MKKISIWLLFWVILASCSNNQEATKRKKKQGVLEDTTIPPPVSRAEAKPKNHAVFVEFWADFQEGVFGRNNQKIAEVTAFPFIGDFTCNEVFNAKENKNKEKEKEKQESKKEEPTKRKPITKDIFLKCIVGEFDKCLLKAIGEADIEKVQRTGLIEFQYIPELKGKDKPKNIKPSGRVTLTFKNINGFWRFTGMYLKGNKPDNCPI